MWLRVLGTMLVAASLAYVFGPLGRHGLSPQDVVGLLGFPLGVAALVVSVIALRKPLEANQVELARGWAATLAAQVKETEERQWRQLLGNDTRRINLAFSLRADHGRGAATPASEGRMVIGPSAVLNIVAFFRRTKPRRLVVTGAPGAGKTVLAVELILALLEDRADEEPVPVRLSMAEWKPGAPLEGWLARHLVTVYDWPSEMAGELVRQHRVLPVLDGLDEMDATDPSGLPRPTAPRALAALRELNAYQEGRTAGPVVLTCRAAHYEALAAATRLLDAARVEIAPVPSADAATYLRERTTDTSRWQAVLDVLCGDPDGVLGATLSTPWRLCLASTVYAREGDPTDLLDHSTPEKLDAHLLARYIPAAVALARPGAGYRAADVHHWLAHLASYLSTTPDATTDEASEDGADLVLHDLWPAAGRLRVRIVDGTLTALVVLGITTAVVLMEQKLVTRSVSLEFATFAAGTVAILSGLFAARSGAARPIGPAWRRLFNATGRRMLLRALVARLPITMAAALAGWILSSMWRVHQATRSSGHEVPLLTSGTFETLPPWLLAGLAIGVAAGLNGGLAKALRIEPDTTTTPRGLMRGELSTTLTLSAAVGLAFGLGIEAVGTGTALVLGSLDGGHLIEGVRQLSLLMLGPALWSVVSAGSVAALTRTVIRRYMIFLLCSHGQLPWRLGIFLDWSCAVGIMRFAGIAYQFRHRELQRWLTQHPNPAPAENLIHPGHAACW